MHRSHQELYSPRSHR